MYKVLLVDDEPRSIEGLEIMIDWEALGFVVDGSCANGEEAIERIKKDPPDVVITDIQMPGMDGLELIQQVKNEITSPIKFVIMSAYSEFEYAKKAMEQGVKYYILKPLIEEEVIEVIKEVRGQLDKQLELEYLQEQIDEETVKNVILKRIQGIHVEEEIKEKMHKSFPRKDWYYVQLELNSQKTDEVTSRIIENIEETIGGKKDTFLISTKSNCYGIVISVDRNTNEYTSMEFVKHLYKAVSKISSIPIFFALGRKVSSILRIKEAYNTAVETMKFKAFMKEPGILTYEDIKDKVISFEFEEIQYVEKLFDALTDGNQKKVNEIITLLEKEFYKKRISPEILKLFIINIVYKGLQIVEEKDRDYEQFLSKNDMKRVSEGNLTIKDMIFLLRTYSNHMIEYVMKRRNTQSKGVMYDIEQYVQKHFTESITIKKAAEEFLMNPVYLGQVFAKTYGVSFNKYVHQLRIEEAKRLLKETDMKLNEIAEQVGYTNYSRFIKKFEKYVKIKPADFQEK